MVRENNKCLICGNKELIPVLSLGEQALTGVFPKSPDEEITRGPLELVKCREDGSGSTCGLCQLRHLYDLNEMYGDNYGYRSGLNQSMVRHLKSIVDYVLKKVSLTSGDAVIDIASNDGTLLSHYPQNGQQFLGIDPTSSKFRKYYPSHVEAIPEFFSARVAEQSLKGRKAKIITSIAVFYDLESPLDFMRDIHSTLADDGIWVMEQSYMPSMLERVAYDTICHEHLEYYGLRQINWLAERADLRILDVQLNDSNGGSFRVALSKRKSSHKGNPSLVESILRKEISRGLTTSAPFEKFEQSVRKHRDEFLEFFNRARAKGHRVFGYGASTKGNVILQFCGITEEDLPCIAEINQEKYGAFTPGTNIPIVSEESARKQRPEYLLILPWHFREGIIKRESEYLRNGGRLVFPLPSIEVVGGPVG